MSEFFIKYPYFVNRDRFIVNVETGEVIGRYYDVDWKYSIIRLKSGEHKGEILIPVPLSKRTTRASTKKKIVIGDDRIFNYGAKVDGVIEFIYAEDFEAVKNVLRNVDIVKLFRAFNLKMHTTVLGGVLCMLASIPLTSVKVYVGKKITRPRISEFVRRIYASETFNTVIAKMRKDFLEVNVIYGTCSDVKCVEYLKHVEVYGEARVLKKIEEKIHEALSRLSPKVKYMTPQRLVIASLIIADVPRKEALSIRIVQNNMYVRDLEATYHRTLKLLNSF